MEAGWKNNWQEKGKNKKQREGKLKCQEGVRLIKPGSWSRGHQMRVRGGKQPSSQITNQESKLQLTKREKQREDRKAFRYIAGG